MLRVFVALRDDLITSDLKRLYETNHFSYVYILKHPKSCKGVGFQDIFDKVSTLYKH